ncbi:hypothetical protein BURK1_03605 [Burkholderiales bacterium]|nr:hypothetical protein BURK1_03605 [Burkholderiales bacterium]
MRRLGIGLAWALAGYVAGALAGYALVAALSPNVHDRDVEAAMTAVFVAGPLAALAAFVAGFVRAARAPAVGGASTPPG